MSDLATLYERNAAFVSRFEGGGLPITPKLSTVVLTCVDARVDPAHYAGLEVGDAFVMRNVGARVTDAVAREISMVWMLMSIATGVTPSLELAIIQHTACGMARFAEPEVAARVTERFGSADVVNAYAIRDLPGSVIEDIERLRAYASVPDDLKVSGHVYDIATGRLTEVAGTQPLR